MKRMSRLLPRFAVNFAQVCENGDFINKCAPCGGHPAGAIRRQGMARSAQQNDGRHCSRTHQQWQRDQLRGAQRGRTTRKRANTTGMHWAGRRPPANLVVLETVPGPLHQ